MLKRNDLVKQFELVVKQEMKNHNDAKLATNLSINYLKKSVDTTSLKFDLRCSKLESEMVLRNSEYRKLQHSYNKLEEWKDIQDRNLFNNREEILKELKETSNELSFSFKAQKVLEDQIINIMDLLVQCDNTNKFLECQFGIEIDRMKKYFNDSLTLLKEEIMNIPSEAEEVKKFILEKMEVQYVDFSGVTRDIILYKKTLNVIEKNIENLYTQIERLK